jgi:ADP-heptose:LPS heptosyltransferase
VNKKRDHILVIRLGALGDLVFCFQSFFEIRQAHPEAEIALLTRAPFAAFARTLPWFDRVIVETHPRFTNLKEWRLLLREIRSFRPTRIYDLQGKRRQSILYTLLGGPFGPEWSGAAPLCKFPRLWPPTPGMHFCEFLAAQLRLAAVSAQAPVDMSWFDASVEKFDLPEDYVVFVPGCSPGAPHKRWPAEKFAELALKLKMLGIPSVVVGTKIDADVVREIQKGAPGIIDLCEKTNLFELGGVLRRSKAVIGNDTGPTHLAAALGASTLALFSGRSNPTWSKPPGKRVSVLQCTPLSDLTADVVYVALTALMKKILQRDQ